MIKISLSHRAAVFWENQMELGNVVLFGKEFPNEYVQKALHQMDRILKIRKGLYLLKNPGETIEEIFYPHYWEIVTKFLTPYLPWSIEKTAALKLQLGDDSIPLNLTVRSRRKVKYVIPLPLSLKISIRPDPSFHENTCIPLKKNKLTLFCDLPEKVVFEIKTRDAIDFIAFLKGIAFDPLRLEILYASAPKPIRIKRLIYHAEKVGRKDLAKLLQDILRKYTIYRPSLRGKT